MGRALVARFMRQHWLSYVMAIFAVGIAKTVQVQIPNLIGDFINHLRHATGMGLVQHYALELAGVSVVFVVLFGFGQYQVNRLARLFEADLRRQLFQHWETLESHYFYRHTVGDLLSHVLNDIPAIRQAMGGGVSQILQAIFLFAATLYMTLGTINVGLTVVALLPLLLIPIVVIRLGPRIRGQSRTVQESLSRMSDLAEESLGSIRLIKSTANEAVEGARFARTTDQVYTESMRLVRLNTTFQALIPLLSGISFAVALSYGGDLALRHTISLGSFVAFTVYLAMLVRPLMQFGNVINIMQNSSASLLRVQTLLEAKPAIEDVDQPLPLPKQATISIRHLTYQYPDAEQPMLSDVSLTIPAGTTLGIVGRTGAGKSTLCNLLLREIDPPWKTIFFDNVDIRQIHRHDLRSEVTYVPQDGFLFSASIGHNIGFPLTAVGEQDLAQAADKARILDTVHELPEQFDTVVGERGINLSGGQRQRVAMARALIKSSAQLVIFDDSLSAVDSRTETEILKNLAELKRQGRTTIIVSHRLSSLRDCDRIAVLDHGRLVDFGPPGELMRRPGLYRELYEIQSGGGLAHGGS